MFAQRLEDRRSSRADPYSTAPSARTPKSARGSTSPARSRASFLYSASPATPRSPQASMISNESPLSGGGSPSAAAKLQQATSAWRSERKVDESERVKTPEAPTEDPSRVKNRWAETPSRSGSKTPRSVTAPSSSNKDVKGLAKDLKSAWTEFGGSSKETGVAAKGANGSGETVPRLMEHA